MSNSQTSSTSPVTLKPHHSYKLIEAFYRPSKSKTRKRPPVFMFHDDTRFVCTETDKGLRLVPVDTWQTGNLEGDNLTSALPLLIEVETEVLDVLTEAQQPEGALLEQLVADGILSVKVIAEKVQLLKDWEDARSESYLHESRASRDALRLRMLGRMKPTMDVDGLATGDQAVA